VDQGLQKNFGRHDCETEVESERELQSHNVAHAQHAHVCLDCDTLAFGVTVSGLYLQVFRPPG
jgi:hypothetical protein